MRDAAAAPFENLVARAHHVLAGAQLDLFRPRDVGQQFGNRDRARGEGRDPVGDRHDVLLAHRGEADGTRRDRDRMAVLDPQHELLARGGSGKAGVPVGGPGVGVMRAGEGAVPAAFGPAGLVENVERVFDDVVPGRADDVQKKLSAKAGQSKPLAYLPTVENDGACGRLAALGPFGQNLATIVEQGHPAGDRTGSVPRPVIRRHQPGVQIAGVAEKSEVRGEIERIEIGAAVGQAIGRDPHSIEAKHLGPVGQAEPHLRDGALGIECGHEDRADAAAGEFGYGLRGAAENVAAAAHYFLDIDPGDLDSL